VKLHLQILFFLLTWFNLSATPAFAKVALPSFAVSFQNTENPNLKSELKIGVSNFARSSILENSFSQIEVFWERSVIENPARKVVQGAGSVFKVGDNIAGFFVNRIKNGTNGKIAIVGRKMSPVETVGNSLATEGKQIELFNTSFQKDNIFKIDGVDKTWGDITSDFNNLKKQYGTIPDNILQNSLMYKANLVWAEKIKTQGYTIIDLGNPTNEIAQSVFYNMEVQTIFP